MSLIVKNEMFWTLPTTVTRVVEVAEPSVGESIEREGPAIIRRASNIPYPTIQRRTTTIRILFT